MALDGQATPHSDHEQYQPQHGSERSSTSEANIDNAKSLNITCFPSSRIMENDVNTMLDQENISPVRKRHSRILSGTELSPLKLLQDKSSSTTFGQSLTRAPLSINPRLSPRKALSPAKRIPVRAAPSDNLSREPASPTLVHHSTEPSHQSLHDEIPVANHQGLQLAIDIFEDRVDENKLGASFSKANVIDVEAGRDTSHDTGHDSSRDNGQLQKAASENDKAIPTDGRDVDRNSDEIDDGNHEGKDDDESAGPDDTMFSNFSAFSAVPGINALARLGQTPILSSMFDHADDASMRLPYPLTSGASTQSPARRLSIESTSLLDFTDHFGPPSSTRTPRAVRESPYKAARSRVQRQSIVNLLDFELAPVPTPRSIPVITARELETLKSGFLSEISSLKASFSGKEAEVLSLKCAVVDAEKRVGECMEQLRDERAAREQLANEKASWEKRSKEMEQLLLQVREDVVLSQHEREELEAKLDETKKRCRAAEMMAQDAETKLAATRAAKIAGGSTSPEPLVEQEAGDGSPEKSPASEDAKDRKSKAYYREVENAMENMGRNLHELYRSKHDVKVASVKKSYEARLAKKIEEFESKISILEKEKVELQACNEAAIAEAHVEGGKAEQETEYKAQLLHNATQITELQAELDKLQATIGFIQKDNESLRQELEQERIEKGDLVTLAEELMHIQSMQSMLVMEEPTATPIAGSTHQHNATASNSQSLVDSLRASMRGTGLKAPVSVKASGIAMPSSRSAKEATRPDPKRSANSAPGGNSRLGHPGVGSRSVIMSSIERMGSHRGRGD